MPDANPSPAISQARSKVSELFAAHLEESGRTNRRRAIHARIISIWVAWELGCSPDELAKAYGLSTWYVRNAIERVTVMRADDANRFFIDAILKAAKDAALHDELEAA